MNLVYMRYIEWIVHRTDDKFYDLSSSSNSSHDSSRTRQALSQGSVLFEKRKIDSKKARLNTETEEDNHIVINVIT